MMKTFKTITTQELITLVCDSCGLKANAESDYGFHEFISIEHHCGYGTIHSDGNQINIDLCQQCFEQKCGDSFRVADKSVDTVEVQKNSEINRLEYNNIFEAITKSKHEAYQLKENCDLILAARDILSKDIIANNNELTVALKRVEQLWDAQYQSAEGNELHQLADLICSYEKKDWDSFFEQAPLADDEFMPGRLNFKSKFTLDSDETASGLLSNMSINKNFDDEASRDSAIAGNNFDEANNHLLESILHARAKYPDLRFGQLLVNAMNLEQPCPEIFHIEDDELIERFNQLLEL